MNNPNKYGTLRECGCCGCFHFDHLPARGAPLSSFDCRNDAARFDSPEDAATRTGAAGFAVVYMEDATT